MIERTATQNKSIKDNYRMNEAHDNENNSMLLWCLAITHASTMTEYFG